METTKRVFRVERRDINYLRSTIESYDGMAVVKTLDPHKALIEIQVSPGCEEFVLELMTSLSEEERIMIEDAG
ncbi:MAG: DUF4911 domain-containing protein [Desulfobacteraceae bacterium]|nr:DUF4911 domain-containing protein [Desulfobacteraceae bacterium]